MWMVFVCDSACISLDQDLAVFLRSGAIPKAGHLNYDGMDNAKVNITPKRQGVSAQNSNET
jgi:hypothetical protein